MLQICTFLVIDSNVNLRSLRTEDRGIYKFTNNGSLIYPLETPLPIIKSGTGCVGVAVIQEMRVTATKTMVLFKVTEVSDSDGKVYYNLYRNTQSMRTEQTGSDVYDGSEDVVIPGAMMSTSAMHKPNTTPRSSNESRPQRNDDRRSIGDLSLSDIASSLSSAYRNTRRTSNRFDEDEDDD